MFDTNLFYLIIPVILCLVIILAVFLDHLGVPVILVSMCVGIVFGSDVLGLWDFDNFDFTTGFANLALVFILFYGGFATKKENFKLVALPSSGLATYGVILTAIFSFACMYFLLGWDQNLSMLLAVIISSTDAAATFSILRRQSLDKKLQSLIEVESAANDPMAILLTMLACDFVANAAGVGANGGEVHWLLFLITFSWKFTMGPAIGYGMGRLAAWIFNRLTPEDNGYYYVFYISIALATYGISELLNASGMLAVFIAGLTLGNLKFAHKNGVSHFSTSVSTIANVCLFVIMGVLIHPLQLIDVAVKGAFVFLFITLVARPLAVFLGTLGMKMPFKDKVFISWAGLRGSVPIVLATYPMAYGIPGALEIFNIVFFVVLLSFIVQGSTLAFAARLLKLSMPSRPSSLYSLEFFTKSKETSLEIFTVEMPDPKDCEGPLIRELKLPQNALILMITRGTEVLPPRGDTRLLGWDSVTFLAHAHDENEISETLLSGFSGNSKVG